MAIPFSTSLITIVRSTLSATADPYDPPSTYPNPESVVVAVGIRAVVAPPSASVALTIGDRVVYTSRLICDPVDLREGDLVTENYGRIWEALGPSPWGAFALSGTQATLRLVQGYAQ